MRPRLTVTPAKVRGEAVFASDVQLNRSRPAPDGVHRGLAVVDNYGSPRRKWWKRVRRGAGYRCSGCTWRSTAVAPSTPGR